MTPRIDLGFKHLHPVPERRFDNGTVLGRKGVLGAKAPGGPFEGCVRCIKDRDLVHKARRAPPVTRRRPEPAWRSVVADP